MWNPVMIAQLNLDLTKSVRPENCFVNSKTLKPRRRIYIYNKQKKYILYVRPHLSYRQRARVSCSSWERRAPSVTYLNRNPAYPYFPHTSPQHFIKSGEALSSLPSSEVRNALYRLYECSPANRTQPFVKSQIP